jgi:lipopolysaccharide biosynthesis glycosyltransferase
MLASVLRFDHGAPLHIHMMSDGIDAASIRRIAAMAEAKGAAFSVYDVETLLAGCSDDLPVTAHFPRAAYARVFLGAVLPPTVGRVIYLDVDTLCRGSLAALWAVDLGETVAAVTHNRAVGDEIGSDLGEVARLWRDYDALRLGLPQDGVYFNSGVMLIDLARWRDERIADAALQWLRANVALVRAADQDALNCVLRARVTFVSDAWNWLAMCAWHEPGDDVRIMHFAGPEKPWHADCRVWGTAEWRAVKAASPFHGVRLKLKAGGVPSIRQTVRFHAVRLLRRPVAMARTGLRCDVRHRRPMWAPEIGVTETIGGVQTITNDAGNGELSVRGPNFTLPPGSYAMDFRLTLLEDIPWQGESRKFVRFEIRSVQETKIIVARDVAVVPGAKRRDVPVTLDFVLPGPAPDVHCRVRATPGLRLKMQSHFLLMRRTAWRGNQRLKLA